MSFQTDTHVTFIIPTVGRSTLARSLDSLLAQTNSHWDCVVMGDGVDPALAAPGYDDDPRIHFEHMAHEHHEATMRNAGVAKALSAWVAWLDDDDTVHPNYVQWLSEAVEEDPLRDVVMFRQTKLLDNGEVLVFPSRPAVVWGNVGISYAVRHELALRHPFKRSLHEDLLQLVALEANNARIYFSPHIAYFAEDVVA